MKWFYILIAFIFISCKGPTFAKEFNNDTTGLKSDATTNDIQGKERLFEKTVYDFINAYNTKKSDNLKEFIHSNTGIYIIYRIGSVDFWKREKTICFSGDCEFDGNVPEAVRNTIDQQHLPIDQQLMYSRKEIVKSCDSITERGLFYVKTPTSQNFVSKTMKDFKDAMSTDSSFFNSEELDALNTEIKAIQDWEKDSRQIVLSYDDRGEYGGAFIFYLTYIKNKWYLTALDFVSTDCSI